MSPTPEESNNLPKVLVISQLPPPVHGSTVMTQVFLETLNRLGYSNILIDRRFSANMEQVGKPSVAKIFSALGLFFRLIHAIIRNRADVCVFFVTTRPGSLIVDWCLSEVLAVFRVPTVAYLHTLGFGGTASKSFLWKWIVQRLLNNCQKIVALSSRLYADPSAFAPDSEYFAVPNTVLEEIDRGSQRASPSQPHVIYMSNLIPDKGAKDFVLLAKKLMPLTDAKFSLIGASTDEGFVEELQLLVHEMGLSDRLSMPGPLYGDDKWNALAEATALVFPSRYPFEAQPLTIIEALRMGTPILAYRAGAIDDCVVSGETGWVSDPGDIDTLVKRLCDILADDAEWSALSDRCQVLYADRFSRAAYERSWHEILKSF